jgi:NAD(P)-dependent dehydrogenase (short-subunit alcohol dehydrogenase family)
VWGRCLRPLPPRRGPRAGRATDTAPGDTGGRAPTTKGALRTLTKALATGLGEYGITVNGVNSGFMDTVRDYETYPGVTPEYSAQHEWAMHPIKCQPRPGPGALRSPAGSSPRRQR